MQQTVFLKQAELIGERICRHAFWSGDECYWEDNFTDSAGGVVRRPVGLDVYFGASGIALFLAALHSQTSEQLYQTTAEGSAQLILRHVEDLDPRFPIGFFVGYLGIAHTLIQLGEAFGNEQFIAGGRQLVREAGKRDVASQGLDILSGAAGTIPVLLKVYRKYSDDFALDLAIKYGNHLIDNPLNKSGFAHGDDGIAWALLELSAVTGEKRFLTGAEKAFGLHQSWPTLFQSDSSWCNGAGGICLSRLRAYELTQNQIRRVQCEDALRIAATTTDDQMKNQNYSLCHGRGGLADLFIYASHVLDDARYKNFADKIGLDGIEQFEEQNLPWPCGAANLGETLNLMSGLAGIGYFYLRLYQPELACPGICFYGGPDS